MILLIDNFDSFSYNLYQLAGTINSDIKTVRNNEVTPDDVRTLAPTHIIISPGPGKPSDAGNCIEIIKELAGEIPILGVCLGHQAICEAFGGKVIHAGKLVHGKAETITIATRCSRDLERRYRRHATIRLRRIRRRSPTALRYSVCRVTTR